MCVAKPSHKVWQVEGSSVKQVAMFSTYDMLGWYSYACQNSVAAEGGAKPHHSNAPCVQDAYVGASYNKYNHFTYFDSFVHTSLGCSSSSLASNQRVMS